MKVINEFKEFAVKGNVMDMAIGVIVGTAFGKITASLVSDIMTPALGFFLGKVDFGKLQLEIIQAKSDVAGNVINPGVIIYYGKFLQVSIDFIIVALCMFLVVKGINSMKRKAEDNKDVTVPTPKDIELLTEIRDLLKTGAR